MCLRLVSWGRTYCYTNQLTCDRNGGEGSDLVWLGCGDAVPKEVCVCLQQTGMHHGSHARFLHLFLALGLLGRGRGLLPGKCASSSEKGHLSRFDAFVHFSGPGKVQILIKGVVAKRLNNPAAKMEWHEISKGRHLGLLKNFLKGLGLPLKNAGQRAGTYNALLRQAGKPGRLVETKLKTKAGKKPWVAAKKTFRDLYKLV